MDNNSEFALRLIGFCWHSARGSILMNIALELDHARPLLPR
jgi:hypothetical protein